MFHLPAIADLLIKNAEFIAYAVTNSRKLKGGQGIQVAGRQPAQSSVAEARLLFLIEDDLNIVTFLLCSLTDNLVYAEVDQIVFQMRTEEKFRGKVADRAHFPPSQLVNALDPAV